jgi:hypothetical protein
MTEEKFAANMLVMSDRISTAENFIRDGAENSVLVDRTVRCKDDQVLPVTSGCDAIFRTTGRIACASCVGALINQGQTRPQSS